jgi:hypothetical protein
MGFGDWRHPPQDDLEWLKTASGMIIYELEERIAICVLSGVPPREAVDIARLQVHGRMYAPRE